MINEKIKAVNGTQTFDVETSGAAGHFLVLSYDAKPLTGTVSVSARPLGGNDFLPIPNIQNKPVSSSDIIQGVFGVFNAIRITQNGLTGSAQILNVTIVESESLTPSGTPYGASAIDSLVYSGLKGLTIQSFTEANCKNGTQYEISSYNGALAIGGFIDTIVVTGSQPVLIKSRQIGFDGTYVFTETFKNPTYSGGVSIPYYNLDTIAPVAGLTQFLAGATVTATGTQIAAVTHCIGSEGVGRTRVGSFGAYAAGGLERVLAPNSSYLFRVTNGNGAVIRISVYATWYEGPLSTSF